MASPGDHQQPFNRPVRVLPSHQGITARASTSSMSAGRYRAATCTAVLAGARTVSMYASRAARTSGSMATDRRHVRPHAPHRNGQLTDHPRRALAPSLPSGAAWSFNACGDAPMPRSARSFSTPSPRARMDVPRPPAHQAPPLNSPGFWGSMSHVREVGRCVPKGRGSLCAFLRAGMS